MNMAVEIDRLETLSTADLRERWKTVTGTIVPKVSPALLRLALAWELQARAQGGLSRKLTRMLDQLAYGQTKTAPTRPDTRLVRVWEGNVYVVIVGEGNVIRWDGREWRSLSEVARPITGIRLSGATFFRLKKNIAS